MPSINNTTTLRNGKQYEGNKPSLYLRLYLSVLLPRIPTIFCSKALKKNGDDQPEEGKHAAPAGGEPGAVRAGPAVQHNQRGDVRHIRQIRIGTSKDTRGTAFVVYEDIYDAKTAVDHLSGFNVANRYLIVLYYQQAKMSKKFDQCKKDEELTKLQEKYGVSTKDKMRASIREIKGLLNLLRQLSDGLRHNVQNIKRMLRWGR
ncbi:hypothetical protein RJ640_022710 [Escallonia rubra]|uniref:RRM domain-containing protein n=1 Tax=Escallonia rubra TaxID=112253 RepID=A0AA88S4U0_9ASTE|nr:hypothetical protein RJ640_022710 [Escallonia rubra]